MKKIILLLIPLLVSACNLKSEGIDKTFIKKINKSSSYQLEGKMTIYNDEETYKYILLVKYLKEDNYFVQMINEMNNAKQIILKNEEGLYVITPALNKSYKFESTWPDNSSQGYILKSLVKDIENDKKTEVNNDKGTIKCKVDYPNNPTLKYEIIKLDDKNKLKAVEIYDKDNELKIKITFNKVKLNADIDDDDFEMKKYITSEDCEEDCGEERTMGSVDNIIYPMYLPVNTHLSESKLINEEGQNRAILTFKGDKNFVLVEEPSVVTKDYSVMPVLGDPALLNGTIAVISQNSVYWTENNIDYYLASNDLSQSEMSMVAHSVGRVEKTMATK